VLKMPKLEEIRRKWKMKKLVETQELFAVG
jgi:hypothetical protein